MEKNKKITSIYLWSFIFIVVIGLNNLNSHVWSGVEQNLIFTGGKVISFFIFLAGYCLMKNYKENKGGDNWQYSKKVFSTLYPALFGGVLFAFIIRNAINGIKFSEIIPTFMNSIWEFLGLSQIGTFTLWNNPLWLFSAIILSSLILYYIVSLNEKFMIGIFAPLFIILFYTNPNLLETIGISSGIVKVMAGMCAGILMYYIVDYFQRKKFSENMTMAFSIVHIGIAMIFVYTLYNGISWSELANELILYVFCIVLLTNKDYISVLYNNSKICTFLGRISLYYYACHICFVYLLSWLFPSMSYHANMIFNILFSLCWAFIMMYIDDYVITPIFRNNKKEIKKENKTSIKKTKKTTKK